MTEIEDLVRQALAQTPVTATTDPFVGLERRIRRARRWLAIGAGGAAAAVIAAIVVPVAVLSGSSNGGLPNRITVGHNPTPAPSVSNPPGVTTLVVNGAVSVSSAPEDTPWALVNTGNYYVAQPGGDVPLAQAAEVNAPAKYVAAGTGVAWVVGSDGNASTSRVSAVTSSGVLTRTFDSTLLGNGVVVDRSLYVTTGDSVERMDVVNGAIQVTATSPVASTGEIAASQLGHVWVQSATKKLVELIPTATGMKVGATVDWTGDIYGPTGRDANGDDLWAYDGDRLIALTPSNLQVGVSVAEGWRITVAGRPTAVATDINGGLYAAVANKGIYYHPAADVQGAGTIKGQPLAVSGVTSMAADPNGGVDYVDSQGQLNHWDPTAGASAR